MKTLIIILAVLNILISIGGILLGAYVGNLSDPYVSQNGYIPVAESESPLSGIVVGLANMRFYSPAFVISGIGGVVLSIALIVGVARGSSPKVIIGLLGAHFVLALGTMVATQNFSFLAWVLPVYVGVTITLLYNDMRA